MKCRAACSLLILMAAGCSVINFSKPLPMQETRGDNVVCVIMNDKRFKHDLAETLKYTLEVDGYTVIKIDRKYSELCNPADYAAVVYMAEYRFWHVPGDAKKYYRRSRVENNVIFVITAANSERKVTEPFDAITTASQSWKLHGVSLELLTRLNRILDE